MSKTPPATRRASRLKISNVRVEIEHPFVMKFMQTHIADQTSRNQHASEGLNQNVQASTSPQLTVILIVIVKTQPNRFANWVRVCFTRHQVIL